MPRPSEFASVTSRVKFVTFLLPLLPSPPHPFPPQMGFHARTTTRKEVAARIETRIGNPVPSVLSTARYKGSLDPWLHVAIASRYRFLRPVISPAYVAARNPGTNHRNQITTIHASVNLSPLPGSSPLCSASLRLLLNVPQVSPAY